MKMIYVDNVVSRSAREPLYHFRKITYIIDSLYNNTG